MPLWVVHGQPFGRAGGIEVPIGRDQRHWTDSGLLALLVDCEGSGQLHSVISAEGVRIRQPHRIVEQGGGNLDDDVSAR